jgi:hypothetical protein
LITLLSEKNFNVWFSKSLPEEFREHYVNPYGDLIGLYHIFLDFIDNKIPLKYIYSLNIDQLAKIEEISKKICDNKAIIATVKCVTQIEPRYKVRGDMFKNIVACLKQVYGQQVLSVKSLDMDRIKKSGKGLYDFGSTKEVIYLSKIVQTTFGKKPFILYNNFLNAELIRN